MTSRRTTSSRFAAIAPAVLATALSLAACGSDDSGSSEPASAADLVVAGVDGLKWDEESYAATAGEADVLLRNDSQQPHTLKIVAEDGSSVGAELKTTSKNDEDSGTYSLAAGTYTIICTVPGHGNMKAGLTVS